MSRSRSATTQTNERAGAQGLRARSPTSAWRAPRLRRWSSAAVQGGSRESHDHWPPRLPEPQRQAVLVARVAGVDSVNTGAGHVVRWVCMTHAARAPTTLHGAAGRILLIMVPLGAMTLVQQLVLHILRAPSATARDDRSWVHEQLVVHDGPARHRQHVPDVTVRSSRPLPADHGASRHCDSR